MLSNRKPALFTSLGFIFIATILVLSLTSNAQAIDDYNIYYGSLHEHSNLSDGTGSPSQAYAYARDVAQMDFFGLADHDTYLDSAEYSNIKSAADSFNQDGTFVAFPGFEWTSGTYGHVTIVNSSDFTDHSVVSTFSDLMTWLSSREVVAFYNHPGWGGMSQEFMFFNQGSPKIVGMELWNAGDTFSTYYYNDGLFSNDGNLNYFEEANAHGYRIGAAGGDDNHTATWGTDHPYRLAVLATSKTRADIYAALQARRFYSTLDKNLKLFFDISGQPMGSVIPDHAGTVNISTNDGNGETFTNIKIYRNGVTLYSWSLNNQANPSVSYPIYPTEGDFYFVKVTQTDGDEAISSPIWISNGGTPTSTVLAPTATPNQNFVQNPGFETGSLASWGQWNDMSVVNNNQRSGSYALRAGNSPASSEQTISNLIPNTTYVLTGWAKLASGSTGGVYIGVKNYGGVETQANIATNNYSPVSIFFTTGSSNTSASIYCYRYSGTGYAYCDDFNIISLGTPTTPTPLPTSTPLGNYVLNAGFETSVLGPWGEWNNSVVSSNFRTGTYAMQIGSSSGSGEQVISGLSPNTAYALTGWVKTSSSSVTGQIGVKDYGASEVYLTSNNTNYTQLTVNFTTGASNTTAKIYCYKPTSNGYVYCDDFNLTVASVSPTITPTLTPTRTITPTNTPAPLTSGWINPAANAAMTGGDGNGFEGSPTNGYTDNVSFATDTNSGTNTSTSCSDSGKDRHVFYTYDLSSIPAGSTILGIEVQLQMKVDSTTGAPKSCIELSWDGGITWTPAKATNTFSKTEASYILGGPADTWGHTWVVSELGNLRVRITNIASSTSRDFSLDWIPVRVTYR